MTELLRCVRYLKQAIQTLDGTVAIVAPRFDPDTIRLKRPHTKVKLFGAGKLNALILDALRRADRPCHFSMLQGSRRSDGFGPTAVAGLCRVAAMPDLGFLQGVLDGSMPPFAVRRRADPYQAG